ncbi:MAG TPA: DNA polymerase/3'-5' exonuclease PolX [Moorella mulderi]|nr:DNA polymerase/3'-5' exonuclease PolX [Moorella mulderi]
MTNLELAWALKEMGDLLDIKGEEPYKVRAYHRAAQAIENLEEEVATIYARGDLEKIPGIGKNLAKKIAELLETGRSSFLENLRREVPPGLRDMLAIPGIGSRTVRQIYQSLGITALEELEKAVKEKRLRNIPGIGSKTELAILRGIEMLKETGRKVPLGIALPLARLFIQQLKAIPGVLQAEVTGSVRRGCDMVGDVDIVVVWEGSLHQIQEVISKHPQVKGIAEISSGRMALQTMIGTVVEIISVPPEDFLPALFYSTGSKAHRKRFLQLALSQGKRVSSLGLCTDRWLQAEREVMEELGISLPAEEVEERGAPADKLNPEGETFYYQALGLPYIPPELREDRGELEAALEGRLPRLVERGDIRGDLHMHSNYSDGTASIRALAEAARARGYEYIAITDHSRSLVIAGGLKVEDIARQREEICRLNQELEGITILAGIEVDILPDGRLDYEDEVLKEFDLVIASIHSGFKQGEESLMARLESAMRHPYVDIIGHPTGRMLGRRRPYAVNLERLLDLAAETGTILEINSSPDRLDLNDVAARQAKEKGVLLAINTDAHDPARLADMEYGLYVARRAWLEPQNVVNTYDLESLRRVLKRNRKS